VYYAIDPPLVVNFEDGSAVRFLQITMEIMAHDQKAIESVQKNIPLIRNNLLLLMSNRNYQSLMSREGKEKMRQEALTEIRAVQKKEAAWTSTTCCSPVSWCSNGRDSIPGRHIRRRSIGVAREERQRCRSPVRFFRQRINRMQLPLLETVSRSFAERAGASLSSLLSRDAGVQFTALESAKSADLQAALPLPASLAVVRLKPLPGFAFVSVEPGLLLTCWMGSSADRAAPTRTLRPPSRRPRSVFSPS